MEQIGILTGPLGPENTMALETKGDKRILVGFIHIAPREPDGHLSPHVFTADSVPLRATQTLRQIVQQVTGS